MTYKYGKRSKERLSTCDNRIVNIFYKAIEIMDISIVCGNRGEVDQNLAFESGNSKLKWPDSNHNKEPSKAVDAVPYPTMWDSEDHFYMLNGVIQAIAAQHGVTIRWGGDWDRDNDFSDQKFMDLGHWELVDE